MLFLDGVYTFTAPQPTFHRAPRPTTIELARLLHTISRRVAGLLARQGLLVRDPESDYLDLEPEAFDQLVGASIHYRIAIGPNAGRKALTLRTVPAKPEPFASTLLAKQPGFSLHAATCCEAKQRDKLEKLCRYITRPAIANDRLSTNERGQVMYKLKQPFRDGTTHVVLDPLGFIARLADRRALKRGIEDPDVIATILGHIRIREAAKSTQPRAPPPPIEHHVTSNQDRLF